MLSDCIGLGVLHPHRPGSSSQCPDCADARDAQPTRVGNMRIRSYKSDGTRDYDRGDRSLPNGSQVEINVALYVPEYGAGPMLACIPPDGYFEIVHEDAV